MGTKNYLNATCEREDKEKKRNTINLLSSSSIIVFDSRNFFTEYKKYELRKNLCLMLILQTNSCCISSTVSIVPPVTGEGSSARA